MRSLSKVHKITLAGRDVTTVRPHASPSQSTSRISIKFRTQDPQQKLYSKFRFDPYQSAVTPNLHVACTQL
jgi:hypothetical protein